MYSYQPGGQTMVNPFLNYSYKPGGRAMAYPFLSYSYQPGGRTMANPFLSCSYQPGGRTMANPFLSSPREILSPSSTAEPTAYLFKHWYTNTTVATITNRKCIH